MADLNPGGGDDPRTKAAISGAARGYGQVPLQNELFATEPADSAYLLDAKTGKLYQQICTYNAS